MKVLLIANNCKWKSWDKKIQQLKDWWLPVVDLQITLRHTKFKRIPFTGEMIDNDWYNTNISVKAKEEGFDIVIFSTRERDWKSKNYDGWKTSVDLGIEEIQIGSDEDGVYRFNGKRYEGGKWFHLARHELSHALYHIKNKEDKTHYYWDLNQIDKVKEDLKTVNRFEFLTKAFGEQGTAEISGKVHNPEVVKYFQEAGFAYVKDDETAWCSAFLNWVCMKMNLPRSNALNARSWLYVGKETKTPIVGDIVVFWRGSKQGWEGHVGIYFDTIGDKVRVYGGNQGDKVQLSFYPKAQVLGYRNIIN